MFLYPIFTKIRTKIFSFCENRENPNFMNSSDLRANVFVPMPMFSVKTWWMFWTEKKVLDIKVFIEECFTVLSNPSSWDRIFSVSFILFHYKTCRFSKLKGLEYWERELISLLTVENKYTNVVFSLLSSQSKADQNYDSIPTPPNTKKLRWDIVFYEYNIG